MNQLRPATLAMALLLAAATMLAGCSGSSPDYSVERSDQQADELRERALNQGDR